MKGSSGNDVLQVFSGTNRLEGGSGYDVIFGGSGDDTIKGGSDDDVIDGGGGDDTITGGKGDDIIAFSGDINATGNDIIDGNSGFDTLDFSAVTGVSQHTASLLLDLQADTAQVGTNQTSINGIEAVVGSSGMDHIFGSHNADSLSANAGNDLLVGGDGADFLDGGLGDDHLTGGTGADIFRFDLIAGETDIISDFQIGEDIIDLSGHGLRFADIVASEANDSMLLTAQGHRIELFGVEAIALTEADFLL